MFELLNLFCFFVPFFHLTIKQSISYGDTEVWSVLFICPLVLYCFILFICYLMDSTTYNQQQFLGNSYFVDILKNKSTLIFFGLLLYEFNIFCAYLHFDNLNLGEF